MDTGITNYDDAYYAQKAKEILESGSLWLITFCGTPSFDNPPQALNTNLFSFVSLHFLFWLTALAFSVFGVPSYSAIFSSALFATGIVLMTYRLKRY